MTDEQTAGLGTPVAHPARVCDCWLGGKDNFAADREAAEQMLPASPTQPTAAAGVVLEFRYFRCALHGPG